MAILRSATGVIDPNNHAGLIVSVNPNEHARNKATAQIALRHEGTMICCDMDPNEAIHIGVQLIGAAQKAQEMRGEEKKPAALVPH